MTKRMMAAAVLAAVAGPAHAAEIAWKPLAEARLRYEHVEQDGLRLEANALTARVRGGVQASSGGISALVEAQGNLALSGRYYDGLEGNAARPLVADPENVALYRAQLQFRAGPLTATAGRQKIALDDERFVGNVGFRNNAQTFDAVRLEWTGIPKVKADVSYAWSVRTIWGINGRAARQQAVSGDNVLANLSWAGPVGTLTGFAYLVDQDEAAVQGYRLSSQSYGARLAGGHAFSPQVKLGYQLGYARQSDWRRNPNDYRADYYLADAMLDLAAFRIGGGYEVLGAGKGAVGGRALTSFQTPLGTNFKFQGWADKFLTTPPDGVRDLYVSAGWGAKAIGALKGVSVMATWHRFASDRLDRHYGNELDLLAGAKLGRTAISLRYADYHADRFATDTRKAWVQLDWAI